MSKVQVVLNVDDEVKGIGQVLIDVAMDIKNKAALGQYIADLSKDLAPALGDIANLSADLKSNPDNRAFLGMALEQIADAFLFPQAAAPALVVPVAP